VALSLPKATIASILATNIGDERQIVQRAASRALVQAIEATDGFKYSFNNAWSARDEEGLRFSYICQDSMQNKDRHANGFHKTTKHLKGEGERGPRKPTYDCKGSVSVKFSHARKCVEIYYRHYAIHSTVADRKAARYTAKPRKVSELSTGATPYPIQQRQVSLIGALQGEGTAFPDSNSTPPPPQPTPPNPGASLKRKRDSDMPIPSSKSPEETISLAALLRRSEAASRPTPPDLQPKIPTGYSVAPPVDYALPSWQTPPAPPPAVSPQVHSAAPIQEQQPYRPAWNGAGYAPPYRLQQYQQTVAYPTTQPPVAIPRAAQQQHLQEHQSLSSHHSQPQGLFSTLKPVRKDDYTTTGSEPHFIIYQSNRARTSCHNCRLSKKKCDEGRPICGACARTNKPECIYEAAPIGRPNMWQPPPGSGLAPPTISAQVTPQQTPSTQNTTASSQTMGRTQPAREPSPDPWFAKR